MSRSATARRFVALALSATLLFAACGDDDDVSSDDATPTSVTDTGTEDTGTEDADTEDTGTEDTGTTDDGGESDESATAPDDVCTIVAAADVEAIIGEANVVGTTSPSGGCEFGSDDRGLYPIIEIAEDVDGAGGITGAQQGAEATLAGTAEVIDIDGDPGYFITGEFGAGTPLASTSTQAAVSHGGLIITVTMSGEATQDVATGLLALAIAGL